MPVRDAEEEDMVDRLDGPRTGVLEAIPLVLAKALGKLAMETGIEDKDEDDVEVGVLDVVGGKDGIVEVEVGVAWLA